MKRSRGGFTLIELIVTVAIVAIAMMVAVPSMLDFQRNAELTSAVNSLTAAINAAKGEAMKRNGHAHVVPLDTADWNNGYQVYVDVDTADVGYVAGTDVLVMKQDSTNMPANLLITGTDTAAGTAPYIRFDGSGYARNATGFSNLAITVRRRDTIGKPQEYDQTRHIMIAQTGRVRTCKPKNATDADCNPASP